MNPVPVTLPELGAGAQPVWISAWLVEPGQNVLEGDRIVETLVAGMTFDIASPATGTLSRVDVVEQSRVATGDVLGWIDATV